MEFFGVSVYSAAVSSQFTNKPHKSNCHTKAQCCNSFFGWVPLLVLMVSKSGTRFAISRRRLFFKFPVHENWINVTISLQIFLSIKRLYVIVSYVKIKQLIVFYGT